MEICGSGQRERETGVVLGKDSFVYRLDYDWAKWPEGMEGLHVLNGSFRKNGNLIVCTDDPSFPLIEWAPDGTLLRTFGEGLFDKAHSVFITTKENLLVADAAQGMHIIREITMDGTTVKMFGNLHTPGDSGYDPNYLAIMEAEGRRPEDPEWNKRAKFNAGVESIRRLGKPFCRPCAMIQDRRGRYFAADGYGNAAVHRFAADGTYELSWGGPGTEPGHFRVPHALFLDNRDRLWVADRENARIQVFDLDGNIIAYASGFYKAGGVWGDGNMVFMGELNGGISVFDMDLRLIAQIGYPGSPLHAHGITGDQQGNLYLFTAKKHPKNNILRLERI